MIFSSDCHVAERLHQFDFSFEQAIIVDNARAVTAKGVWNDGVVAVRETFEDPPVGATRKCFRDTFELVVTLGERVLIKTAKG